MYHGHGFLLILSLLYLSDQIVYGLHDGTETASDYSDEWLVQFDSNSDSLSRGLLAEKLGYKVVGEVPGFKDYYVMKKFDHDISKLEDALMHTRRLKKEITIKSAKQLFGLKREHRGHISLDFQDLTKLLSMKRPRLLKGLERDDDDDDAFDRSLEDVSFDDDQWKKGQLWYMSGYSSAETRSGQGEPDLKVVPVYKMGITGRGIRVMVIDDGLEKDHEDLRDNYDPKISHDYTVDSLEGLPDPTPTSPLKSHGTRCAGEIAMVANNRKCGVGIAYNAKIGGVKMLGNRVTDRSEAQALKHAHEIVDVTSSSWGPTDDGKTVEGPGELSKKAIETAIAEGRQGKGVIMVWASGNGGQNGDNCNCDGYTSSIYTLSIGSVSQNRKEPWYLEPCASTAAATFSSGSSGESKVATIDTNNQCTDEHTGTSASAPLAAGIVALALEANPNLTWRDAQHLTIRTARSDDLPHITGWKYNKAGLRYHSKVGFGLMDAERMVTVAKALDDKYLVGPQITEIYESNEQLNDVKATPFKITATVRESEIKHVEHVEVESTLQPQYRGCLDLSIISPSKTESRVLTMRPKDSSPNGFKKWKFTSLHFWGENAKGEWQFLIRNLCSRGSKEVVVGNHSFIIRGTAEEPGINGLTNKYLMPQGEDKASQAVDRDGVTRDVRQFESRNMIETLKGNENWSDLVGGTVRVRNYNPLYE